MQVGIFICICEKDAHWLKQLLPNLYELRFVVSWYADHCSEQTLQTLKEFPYTKAIHNEQVEPFDERSKEIAYKALKDCDWVIQMDSDETWEDGARELILKELEQQQGHVGRCRMRTVWEHNGQMMVRTDIGSQQMRTRIYNNKLKWSWVDAVTNGPYANIRDVKQFDCPGVVRHWGYSTLELRKEHKQRWDEIYTKAIGRNPYKLWDFILEENPNIKLESL